MTMFSQDQVDQWFAANPNATTTDVAQAVQGLGGLDANQGLAGLIGQHYGTDAATVNTAYNQWANPTPTTSATGVAAPGAINTATAVPDGMGITTPTPTTPNYDSLINNAYAGIGRTGVGTATNNIDQGGLDYWRSQLSSGAIKPEDFGNVFNNAVTQYTTANPTDPYTQYVQNYQKTQDENNVIKDYVNNVLADKTLSPWEQTNKIMERAQQVGVTQDRLESVFGKDAVAPYMDTYKKGINDFLTTTLAKDPGTTMNEVGAIHQAAQKYGLTPDEIAKYGGMDPKVAQSYFDQYDQGLGTIMSRLNDPKVDDVTRTKTALALANQYGATDAELAKASNGKYTEKDIKAYLDPVRTVPTNLQKLFDDPNATAKDIQKFISDAKLDPRAAGIYGAALDKMTSNPDLYLRDAVNGKADVSDSYESFLSLAKSTPEMATKYAPQIQAIENAKNIIGKHALNKDFGGEYKDFAMEMFMGLDKNTAGQAPKKLEFTAPKTETRTGGGDEGGTYTYEAVVPGAVKDAGVKPITDEDGNVTGYTKLLDAKAFDETWPGQKERFGVRANYDANGNLTGYESGARVHVSDPQYYQAKWDANGSPRPIQGANQGGGFFKGVMQDVASMGPIGTLALMAATGGLGSLAAGALTSSLGAAAAQAVGSGLVSGVMSEMGGGNFGKGFVGGAVGSGAGQLAGSYMPTNVTGNTFIDSYLTKAAPNVASNMARTGVMGGDMGDAGLASLLNTGVGMGVDYGTNSLLGETGMDKLGAMQPYATGVASNLVSSALTGKDPNLEKALMSTMMQQAMSTGKQAVKTAAKP